MGCIGHTVAPEAPTPIVIPASLTDPHQCTPAKPPTSAALKNAQRQFPEAENAWEARFLIMTNAWLEQTHRTGQCHRQLGAVDLWRQRQLGLMEGTHDQDH